MVYIIGGVLYNKFAKGAKGVELIPNIEFWKELPGLVRVRTFTLYLHVFHGHSIDIQDR